MGGSLGGSMNRLIRRKVSSASSKLPTALREKCGGMNVASVHEEEIQEKGGVKSQLRICERPE